MSKQSDILRQQLKSLQSEADRILDQIDQKEAEILQLENDENLHNLAHQRREILEELEEWVQTQIESTQFYDIIVNIVDASNLISAQVDSPIGVAFNEQNHAELVYDVDTDRVTISHYRDLSMKESRELLSKSLDDKNATIEYAVSDESEDEDRLFYIKTVTVEELPDLVDALKKIKESVNA